MRLIDKDKLQKKYSYYCNHLERHVVDVDDIENMPTVDAEPIRHGHWIPLYPREKPITNLFKCSVCGMGYEDDDTDCQVYFEWDYCPHCGAKMDKKEKDQQG